jgi:collagenase-like PrtC family protease
MKKYATIILPRELGQEAIEDIQQMKQAIENKHDLEIEIIIEEGKQRE